MKDNKTFEMIVKPIIVLSVICLIVSGLLAVTNNATLPVIEANNKKIADAARAEVLPEATSFSQVEYTDEIVTEVYKADNDAGFVITGKAKGYGGDLPVMIGIKADGTINLIKVMDNQETPGVGKKAREPAFTDQFIGQADTGSVSTIGGATISSSAVIRVVDGAFAAYNTVKEG